MCKLASSLTYFLELDMFRVFGLLFFLLAASPVGCRIYTAKINMTESFLASVEDVYSTFTEKEVTQVANVWDKS